jgi:hypothetical protein
LILPEMFGWRSLAVSSPLSDLKVKVDEDGFKSTN